MRCTMNPMVRRALPSDAASIAGIHIRSWQAAYRGQIPDTYLDQLDLQFERRTEFWRNAISNPLTNRHEVWVAGDSPVDGFMAIGPARDMDAFTSELYAIYVSPDRWGQGLGKALVTCATERLTALGYSTAILWVLESNSRARRFYELSGWKVDDGTKLESLPGGIELREVCYRISLDQAYEE